MAVDASGGRRANAARRDHSLLQLKTREVVQVRRVEYGTAGVDAVREELRLHLLAVDEHVVLRGHVLVECLPVVGDRLQVGCRDRVQSLQVGLDPGIVDLAEVLVVGRLDRLGVEEQVEVRRVREILNPVGESCLRLRLLVTDRREVRGVGQDLLRRLEPDLVQCRGVVVDVLLARLAGLAPDGDLGTRLPRFLEQLLGLLQIWSAERPGLALTLRVANDALRQEVARRRQEARRETLEGTAVHAHVDRLTRLRVVEGRLGGVHEHVEGRRDRLLLEAIRRLPVDLRKQRRRERVARVEHVSLVVEDLLGLGLGVRHDLDLDRVQVARRDVRDVEVREPGDLLDRPRAVRNDAGQLVRADARRRVVGQVLHGRALGHEAQRREREHVGEGAVGLRQLDRDLARRVVGGDARDRLGLLAVERGRALDVVGDERLAAPVEAQHALDRVREVGRLDVLAVGVLEPLAQGHRVRLAAVGHLRQLLGQRGDELATGGALLVLVGHEPEIADPGVLSRLRRVALVGVQVVRGGAHQIGDAAALLATAAAAGGAPGRGLGVAAVAATRGERQGKGEQCEHSQPTHE
jgi:hypothetical protein